MMYQTISDSWEKLLQRNEDMKLDSSSAAKWNYAPLQILTQWRWDNDIEALLAEDEVKRQKDRAAALDKQRQRQKYLATVTLSQLREKRRFENWEGKLSQELIDVCRHIFNETIDALWSSREKSLKKKMVAALRECVTRLERP